MSRQALDDGRWFEPTKATSWDEAKTWDGHNWISRSTGSQWEHETLYRTAGGLWVLNHFSQWEGSRETWEEITGEQAARWLVCNEHEPHDACAQEYAALELR